MAALLTIHFVLAVTSVRHKCTTYDELAHLTRGYSYLLTGDFRLGPPHPPLAHYWAALPGFLNRPTFPSRDQNAWRTSDVWKIGWQFFYDQGNDIRSMLFAGRVMIAVLSVGLGLAAFAWSKRLFGWRGGLLSLTLYAFSPTILSSARLVTTDMIVALFFTLALAGIWWVLHTISPLSVGLSSLALAGLFLSKMSAPLIIPIGLGLLLLRLIDGTPLAVRIRKRSWTVRHRAARLGVWCGVIVCQVLITWGAIWMAYGFHYSAMKEAEPGRDRFFSPNAIPAGRDVWEHQLRSLDPIKPMILWLRDHEILPEAYVYSAAMSAQTARGRASFLNGQLCIFGFRSFFPYSFLVKTPLPLFGIMVLAVAVPLFRRRFAGPTAEGASAERADGLGRSIVRGLLATAPLWMFLAFYWAASIRSSLNIGHRHILPTYPLLFILCGSAAEAMRWRWRTFRWMVPGLVGLFVVASVSIWPHYLAYFNWLVGGPRHGYKHLVDSSLDWGQDLPGLRHWLDENVAGRGDANRVYVAYFGNGSFKLEGIRARSIATKPRQDWTGNYTLTGGVYCISATKLQQVYLAQVPREPRLIAWTPEQEQKYQRVMPYAHSILAAPNTREARKAALDKAYGAWVAEYQAAGRPSGDFQERLAEFKRNLRQWPALQFARLCAYLRNREPDDFVGYSILIYRLTDKQVEDALLGPVTMADDPAD